MLSTADLCCAPPTCIVHHGAQAGPMSLVVHMEHARNTHFLSVVGWAQEHTTDTFLGGGTPHMVHSAKIKSVW